MFDDVPKHNHVELSLELDIFNIIAYDLNAVMLPSMVRPNLGRFQTHHIETVVGINARRPARAAADIQQTKPFLLPGSPQGSDLFFDKTVDVDSFQNPGIEQLGIVNRVHAPIVQLRDQNRPGEQEGTIRALEKVRPLVAFLINVSDIADLAAAHRTGQWFVGLNGDFFE